MGNAFHFRVRKVEMECFICCEPTTEFKTCWECGERHCVACFRETLRRTDECPHCGEHYATDYVRLHCDDEAYDEYVRRDIDRTFHRELGKLAATQSSINNELNEDTLKRIVFCPSCSGRVSVDRCDVCDATICGECELFTRDEHHACDENDLASARWIKSRVKQCPACFARVDKDVEGCDQVVCAICGTCWSWNSRIVAKPTEEHDANRETSKTYRARECDTDDVAKKRVRDELLRCANELRKETDAWKTKTFYYRVQRINSELSHDDWKRMYDKSYRNKMRNERLLDLLELLADAICSDANLPSLSKFANDEMERIRVEFKKRNVYRISEDEIRLPYT